MKRMVFVVLLLTFCSLKPAAHDPYWDAPGMPIPRNELIRELTAIRYLTVYGLMRDAVEAPVLNRPHIVEHVPAHQERNIVRIINNQQERQTYNQKRHYQNNKNNNRNDRQHHAQMNRPVNQPKQRNQKRLAKSFQRL